MECLRCTRQPVSVFRPSKVLFAVPTAHHAPFIEAVFSDLELSYEKHEAYYEVSVPDYEAFIRSLTKIHFNSLEKRDMKLLPLKQGETLTFDKLDRYRSLKEWMAFYQGIDLLDVLEKGRIKVFFQPIVSSGNRQVYGYEALIRGVDSQGEMVPPVTLFQHAKNMDLLFFLDRMCRETIIREAAFCGIKHKLFVNFIPTSIYDPEKCLQTTDDAIQKYGLTPEQVVFEVVETEQVDDYDHLNMILNYYRKRGYATALDDMGSGYASLSAMLALSPNYIKIDMGLIRNIHQDPEKQRLVNEYCREAQSRGIIVLAEGVELLDEVNYLVKNGIDLLQGYYFAKPAPVPPEINQ
ncbi:EAL domain-containing protein [Anoxynatronum sibiricum]|uniref:EAL domain-containing protein n=1 Tax=Anoxynatronum sibiricum TaxID=210623 RepID=A0ABU9VRJ9_9CLOT